MGKGKIIPINKKAKEDNRIQKTVKVSIKRLKGFLVFIFIVFIALVARIGAIQFIDGTWLKERAYSQSTSSTVVSAKRGTIYDSNGKALAISAEVDTVSVNPEYLVVKEKGEVNQEKTQELREKMAQKFAEIFSLEYDDVLKKLNSSRSVETIASKVETDKVTTLKAWLKENKISSGVNIDEDVKRYYPYNNLASNLIGFCGTNNQGLDGIELSYDDELKGTNGKLITAISVIQTAIPDQNEQYIAPENGSNIYLTIDSNIQTIVEKYLKQAVEENNCQRGGNAIAVNPENGEILAMATYPDYNLNDPYTPNESLSKGWDKLSSQEQSNKLYSMWRNRAVLDTYEPGSTFKIIAASIGLEEKIVETDTAGDFYCGGSETVSGTRISCANRSGHGSQSLRNALENSCNPALIQLGQRIGVSTFYKYLDAFGFFEKTGIDLPSEGTSSFWKEKNVGPVELATMSFGQRFTITPMQLVKAAAAIANEGKLVTPHVVKEIENPDTGTVKTIQTNEERQVISEDTANKIKDMMKSVVETGGGKYAQVKGYEIGGKTGTSEADPNHPENGYVASFLAIAPVDNTKIVLLLTLYAPKVRNYYGGSIAAPAVSQMLSEILPYLDIPSNNSDEGNVELVSVPNVTNKTIAEAQKILKAAGLEYSSVGDTDNIVSEQVPKSGTQLKKNGIVKIYAEGKDERVSQTVPDVKGVSLAQAKVMLKARNLNISSKGTGIVIAQDPKAGTSVDEGTVINVTLQEATTSGQH